MAVGCWGMLSTCPHSPQQYDINDCRFFRKQKASDSLGLDVQMFLVVDKESINSVLEPEDERLSFVLAQDVEYKKVMAEYNEEDEEAYTGVFKVSVDSLLSSLYVGLQGMHMAPEELWPFADPIFEGTDFF